MPLKPPELDKRTFDEIYEEALRRIPRYTPEWTDYNDSDPGITLVQLFSWLTETMFFEMNQIPERNYIKFLQLMNLELRPAKPASAHLTFSAPKAAKPISVAKSSQISAQDPESGELLIFETEEGVDIIRAELSDVQVYDGSSFTVVSAANQQEGTPYRPFGWIPQVNSALYLGFTPADAAAPGNPFPRQMRFRVFLPQAAQSGAAQNSGEADNPPPAPVELVWEYKQAANAQRWRRLNVYEDETVAFTREGYMAVEGPREIALTNEGKLTDPEKEKRFWLRCRLNSPSYPAGREPEIEFIRPNTVMALNVATVRQEILGESQGTPWQSFALNKKPVRPGSLVLHMESEADDEGEVTIEVWEQKETLLRSGPDDPHFTLNHNTGELTFGDGRHGRIPTAGYLLVADSYRHGGGEAGNVGAGLISSPMNLSGVEVTNLRPAVGGRDEQDVEELKQEAPFMLRSRNRAITEEDFTALAEQAGGIAKAQAIALMNPNHPGVDVPGAVTVVVVPDNEERPPVPTDDEIRQVCRYLNQFRLLTTEVYVKGPTYIKIKVEAQITAEPYAAFDKVSQDVITAINDYLSPLGRRTPRGWEDGWEFGQEFYPTNLYGEIRKVAHVVAVKTLNVIIDGKPYDEVTKPFVVPADGLVYGVANHEIVVEPHRDR